MAKTNQKERARHHTYYLEHRDEKLKYSSNYQKEHPEKIREKFRKYREKLRLRVIAALGGECVVCGLSDFRALQIDHIKGGGVKELRNFNHDPKRYYEHVLAHRKDYQLLCCNHNWIKRYERRETSRGNSLCNRWKTSANSSL